MRQQTFETSLSFTYEVNSPEEAVKMFLANIGQANWFVSVKNIKTKEQWTVDTEDFSVEPKY